MVKIQRGKGKDYKDRVKQESVIREPGMVGIHIKRASILQSRLAKNL